MLLHLRFGHLGAEHLLHVLDSGVDTGLQPCRQQLLMVDPLCGCTPCRLAKASRPGPHPARDRCTTNGRDNDILRLTSDLIGPVEPRGYDGTRYLIGFTILNYSLSKIFSLKSKDQALEKFIKFTSIGWTCKISRTSTPPGGCTLTTTLPFSSKITSYSCYYRSLP